MQPSFQQIDNGQHCKGEKWDKQNNASNPMKQRSKLFYADVILKLVLLQKPLYDFSTDLSFQTALLVAATKFP